MFFKIPDSFCQPCTNQCLVTFLKSVPWCSVKQYTDGAGVVSLLRNLFFVVIVTGYWYW